MPTGEDRQIATGSPRTGSGRLRIGFAICDPGLSFGAIVALGAKERAAELDVELALTSVFTPAEQAAVIEFLKSLQILPEGAPSLTMADQELENFKRKRRGP